MRTRDKLRVPVLVKCTGCGVRRGVGNATLEPGVQVPMSCRSCGKTKIVTVTTRSEPMPATGGKVYHVYPVKWKGPKIQPAFEGIMCAYNYHCGAGDTAPGGRPRVKPGDIRAALESRGTPIGPFDYLIAAQARRRAIPLVTLNRFEFDRVPGLIVVDWAD